jgi:hypothetical protein
MAHCAGALVNLNVARELIGRHYEQRGKPNDSDG